MSRVFEDTASLIEFTTALSSFLASLLDYVSDVEAESMVKSTIADPDLTLTILILSIEIPKNAAILSTNDAA